ncbi:MAG: rRNA maturation RNase YbeY [Nevskiales bacterium]
MPSNRQLQHWVAAVLKRCKRAEIGLGIRLVGAAESQRLNARYRGKDGPTNVLSFPCDLAVPEAAPWLGDVVICAPVVAREARTQGKNVVNHWAHMVVHGVLHLLGHDHIRSRQAARMEALERRILADLKIPDPYE